MEGIQTASPLNHPHHTHTLTHTLAQTNDAFCCRQKFNLFMTRVRFHCAYICQEGSLVPSSGSEEDGKDDLFPGEDG